MKAICGKILSHDNFFFFVSLGKLAFCGAKVKLRNSGRLVWGGHSQKGMIAQRTSFCYKILKKEGKIDYYGINVSSAIARTFEKTVFVRVHARDNRHNIVQSNCGLTSN